MNDKAGREQHDAMLRRYLRTQGLQTRDYSVDMKTKVILVVTPGGAFAHPIQLPVMRESQNAPAASWPGGHQEMSEDTQRASTAERGQDHER